MEITLYPDTFRARIASVYEIRAAIVLICCPYGLGNPPGTLDCFQWFRFICQLHATPRDCKLNILTGLHCFRGTARLKYSRGQCVSLEEHSNPSLELRVSIASVTTTYHRRSQKNSHGHSIHGHTTDVKNQARTPTGPVLLNHCISYVVTMSE